MKYSEIRAVRVVVDQGRRALAVRPWPAHGRDGARTTGPLEVPAAPADDLVLAVAAPFQPRARARDDRAVGVVRVADEVALGRRALEVVDEDAVRALLAHVEDVQDGGRRVFRLLQATAVVAALPSMLAVVHISYALRRTVARARMQVGSQTCKSSACARAAAQMLIRLFVQLRTDTEEVFRRLQVARCANGGVARSTRVLKLVTGQSSNKFFARFIRQQDPAAPRNNVGWQQRTRPGPSKPDSHFEAQQRLERGCPWPATLRKEGQRRR